MQRTNNKLVVLLLVLALVGFIDSAYLTAEHYLGFGLTCSIVKGCEQVTTSQYSQYFGIPVALFGALYYFVLFLMLVVYKDNKQAGTWNYLKILVSLGFLMTLWLVYLQFFVISAICLYCMVSALTTTLLFVLVHSAKNPSDTEAV